MSCDSVGHQATNFTYSEDQNLKRKFDDLDKFSNKNLNKKDSKNLSINNFNEYNTSNHSSDPNSYHRPKVYYSVNDTGTCSVWIKKLKLEGDTKNI